MRITIKEQVRIRELTEKYFGMGSTVRLFGSRVDDTKRGGDIDLYVEPINRDINLLNARADLWGDLQAEMGEQKIDIVLANDEKLLIDREAITKGIILMTHKESKLVETIHECNRHLEMLNKVSKELQSIFPLNIESYDSLDIDQIGTMDIFLFRFTKLQDTMGAKLFPMALDETGENLDGLSFIDKISLLHKLNIVSWPRWKALREKRNAVAHEYPISTQYTVDSLNAAFISIAELYEIAKKTITFVHNQGILPVQIDQRLNVDIPFFEQWERQ